VGCERQGGGRELGATPGPAQGNRGYPRFAAAAGELELHNNQAVWSLGVPAFDDRSWSTGPGGFGTSGTPNGVFGTRWNTPDIWLRRKVTLPAGDMSTVQLMVYHDEDVQVFFNGVLALDEPGYQNEYRPYEIYPAARRFLQGGRTICIAVHCHQTGGDKASISD